MFHRILALLGLALLAVPGTAEVGDRIPHDPQLESIPAQEAAQIENIVRLTVAQMKKRYPAGTPVLRGVHPKDHGCVKATFHVSDKLPEELRVGVFATPGREYPAWVRFSNAAVLVGADSTAKEHGSRGMAIKLLHVEGTPLIKTEEPLTQDFLMVNHPVFAFANVEDYEALSKVLLDDSAKADKADRFFAERIKRDAAGKPDMTIPMTRRAVRTAGIISRIKSQSVTAKPPAYQNPPASPADNRYFSAVPFLFGRDKVMKYAARPVAPSDAAPDVADPSYLRTALLKRLTGKDAKEIVFDFQVQVRSKAEIAGKIETEIEDACVDWDESRYPFATVARIVIPPQDFDTEARKCACENLFFTPWHSVVEHQPIGGINRLKLGVYEASSAFRHTPN
jgi:hypothetical protein